MQINDMTQMRALDWLAIAVDNEKLIGSERFVYIRTYS